MGDSAALWLKQAEEKFAFIFAYHLAAIEEAVSTGLEFLRSGPRPSLAVPSAPVTTQKRARKRRVRKTTIAALPTSEGPQQLSDIELSPVERENLVDALSDPPPPPESIPASAAKTKKCPGLRARRGRSRKAQPTAESSRKDSNSDEGGSKVTRGSTQELNAVTLPNTLMDTPKLSSPIVAPLTIGSGISTIPRKRGRLKKGLGASSITASPITRLASSTVAILSAGEAYDVHLKTPASISKPTLRMNPMTDLSSAGSPLKTPVPMKNPIIRPIATPILPRPPVDKNDASSDLISTLAPLPAPPAPPSEPKFESWTSRFVKNPSFGAASTEKTPLAGKAAALPPLVPRMATVPPPATISVGDTMISATSVEFIPPPTVTRRAPRRDLPPANLSVPADYTESPLTRAKRMDAQNTWREQQLKSFMAAKAGHLKSALGGLRHEQTPSHTLPAGTAHLPALDVVSMTGPASGSESDKSSLLKTVGTDDSLSSHPESEGISCSPQATVASNTLHHPLISTPQPPSDHTTPPNPQLRGSSGLGPPTTIDFAQIQQSDQMIADEDMPVSKLQATADWVEIENLNEPMEAIGPAGGQANLTDSDATEGPRSGEGSGASTCSENLSLGNRSGSGLGGLSKHRAPLDAEEMGKRQRLKERNEKALEKRKNLLQKAAQMKNSIADLSGKAKSGPMSKASHLPVRVTTTSKASTRASTRASPSLQKQAMVNSALKSASAAVNVAANPTTANAKTNVITAGAVTDSITAGAVTDSITASAVTDSITASATSHPNTTAANNEGLTNGTASFAEAGSFRMPLPKVKTPGRSPAGKFSGDHPSSDDTFSVPAKSASGKDPKSPRLPDIHSDASEDELNVHRDKERSKENRPIWANTPEVTKALQKQRTIKPEDIFGDVQPVKLEDFFKASGKKFARGRTSSIWHP